MASAPSVVPSVHFTSVGASSFTVAFSAPYDGGAAIDSYQVSGYFYNLSDGSFAGSAYVTLASTARSGTVNYSAFTPSGWQNYRVVGIVYAHNSVGWSYGDVPSRQGTTDSPAICRATTALTQSAFETTAVSEAGTPFVTPPSAFGVAVRLNQGTDFVFGQLARRGLAADPDAAGANPVTVMNTLQPIIRLALGGADVLATTSDSEKLAGEISSGTLASKKAVVAHTTGASTFTLTNTWTADRAATLYTMAVVNNMPIGYASGGPFYQDLGSVRRTLVWTYDIPSPIGVGPGDTFTTTVTIAF